MTGFDPGEIREAAAEHGRVARVCVAKTEGSAPREAGASMLVWDSGQSGTIGGGALERAAEIQARETLKRGGREPRLERLPLGPALGQCCGGAVTVATEIFDSEAAAGLDRLEGAVHARPVSPDASEETPFAVLRILALSRSSGQAPKPGLVDGWLVEPVARPSRHVWIYGAGHVGRAIVHILGALGGVGITWVDDSKGRFPDSVPESASPLVAKNPADAVPLAPPGAEHYVLTYSHAIDLEICHRLLGRDFAFAGLIGSRGKWARFRKRLAALGHPPERIALIECPLGIPELGKEPHHIAVGVACKMLYPETAGSREGDSQSLARRLKQHGKAAVR